MHLQWSYPLTIVAVEHQLDLWGTFFDRALHVTSSGDFPVEINPTRSCISFPKRISAIQPEVAFEAKNVHVTRQR